MSYFGNDGPAQDGGFLHGIGAGHQRLAVAQKARRRHASKYGFGQIEKIKQKKDRWWEQIKEEGFVSSTTNLLEEDMPTGKWEKLSKEYEFRRDAYQKELTNWKRNSEDVSEADRKIMAGNLANAKKDYLAAAAELDSQITSGPYMREYRVWGLSTGLVLLGAGAFVWAITRKRKIQRAPGRKSAMYAVFG
jgi:hypothetical protein